MSDEKQEGDTIEAIRRLIFAEPRDGITCPFCGECDFDQIGLKNHLLASQCDGFDATLSIADEYAAIAKAMPIGAAVKKG